MIALSKGKVLHEMVRKTKVPESRSSPLPDFRFWNNGAVPAYFQLQLGMKFCPSRVSSCC
jgi:hypothetical protein